MMRIERTIKYEADRVRGFGREIMSVPGCEQLQSCIQCGTCSGACPLSIYMDFSPRQVVALVRAVPGGRSTSRKSVPPQSTANRNC